MSARRSVSTTAPTAALAVLVLSASLAACGSSSDDAAESSARDRSGAVEDGLVRWGVASLPTTAYEASFVSVGDLDRASALAEAERPDGVDDEAGYEDWLDAVTGVEGSVALTLPEVLGGYWGEAPDVVAAEIGTSAVTAERFAELVSAPGRASVVAGPVDLDALEEAYGPGEEGRWRIGEGQDLSTDLTERSALRPLGQPVHVQAEKDLLTAAFVASDLTLALAQDRGDEGALEVAEALDVHEVYVADLVVGASPGDSRSLPEAFDAVGVGLTGDADAPLVVAYHHASSEEAEANADALADVLDADGDARGFELLETSVDGSVLTATLSLDDLPLSAGRDALLRRAPFVSHA
ncbi:hypothetical protein RDV89_05085 [Nocardioides zeae]|uniref:Uncharacterized protein n=1 Tax=Nocardioides imazamoxiresistens TaxID=3231893 RepID=A0ABU3PT97_9ACTN|nr:hypothetical protein [Nocardioides zeae]MDT9592429.1 hypothetical protein [Nocardioides zeae]